MTTIKKRAPEDFDTNTDVKSRHAGQSGCVIRGDCEGHAHAKRSSGANVVVTDLAQDQVSQEPPSTWSMVFDDYDPLQEGKREALCTLGNGYFATRGSTAWTAADDIHYPATYLAGGYNRLRTDFLVRQREDLQIHQRHCPGVRNRE